MELLDLVISCIPVHLGCQSFGETFTSFSLVRSLLSSATFSWVGNFGFALDSCFLSRDLISGLFSGTPALNQHSPGRSIASTPSWVEASLALYCSLSVVVLRYAASVVIWLRQTVETKHLFTQGIIECVPRGSPGRLALPRPVLSLVVA